MSRLDGIDSLKIVSAFNTGQRENLASILRRVAQIQFAVFCVTIIYQPSPAPVDNFHVNDDFGGNNGQIIHVIHPTHEPRDTENVERRRRCGTCGLWSDKQGSRDRLHKV
jgi:hypothetical protein